MADADVWLAVRKAYERAPLRAFALVLTARGIDSRIDLMDGSFRLLVAPDDLLDSARELAAYERENVPPPAPPVPVRIDSGWLGVAGYLASVWLVMACETAGTFGWDWRGSGRLHVDAVQGGEVWRLATALTLHADAGHIVANSVFGAVFGLMAGRYLGSGLAWLAILIGGVSGNALNVLVRPPEFTSIGASTATFAAVGLCAAFMWRSGFFAAAHDGRRLAALRALAPVFAAVALFAYTGIGDERTDVIAHIAGLACGFLIGLWIAATRLQLIGLRAQRFFGATALAAVAAAWLMAT